MRDVLSYCLRMICCSHQTCFNTGLTTLSISFSAHMPATKSKRTACAVCSLPYRTKCLTTICMSIFFAEAPAAGYHCQHDQYRQLVVLRVIMVACGCLWWLVVAQKTIVHHFFFIFVVVAVVKSSASAASPEGLQAEKLDFQAVIKSAASEASPTAWERPDEKGTEG